MISFQYDAVSMLAVSDPTSVHQNLDKILKKHNDPCSIILELVKVYHLDSSSLAQATASEVASMTSGCKLNNLLLGTGLGISFSHMEWDNIAPCLDIEPQFGLARVPYFDLQCAYLPEHIFKKIKEEICVRMGIYRCIAQHKNEEVTTHVIAPVSKLHRSDGS